MPKILLNIEELQSDKDKLISSFRDFSLKYGQKICGFYIIKRQGGEWILKDIIMYGDHPDTVTPLPFVPKKGTTNN